MFSEAFRSHWLLLCPVLSLSLCCPSGFPPHYLFLLLLFTPVYSRLLLVVLLRTPEYVLMPPHYVNHPRPSPYYSTKYVTTGVLTLVQSTHPVRH